MQRFFTILPNVDHMDKLHDDVVAIWLDNTIGTSTENHWFNIAGQLRSIISHVEVFATAHQCTNYICSSGIARIILVVAGTYGDNFDTRLFEEMTHNVFIYILTSNKFDCHSNYTNICGCFENTNKLLHRIRNDYEIYMANTVSDMNVIRVTNNESATRCINPQLIQWKSEHLIMDLFRQMPCPREQSMDRLVQFCTSQCYDNSRDMNALTNFQETYSPENSIRWYNRHNFLHRLLNRAMRTNNLDGMMSFSHVLIDIHDQFHKSYSQLHNQLQTNVVVYHGRLMDIHQLKNLSLNIGGYISNKTIFAASFDYNIAKFFSGEGQNIDHPSALFTISYNSTSSVSNQLVDLSTVYNSYTEKELLFTDGHIFRIDSCELANNKIWLVKLTLCEKFLPNRTKFIGLF